MPILTLVVPQLKSTGLSWRLTGRSTARHCLVERGLLPVLAAPSPSGAPPCTKPLCVCRESQEAGTRKPLALIQFPKFNYVYQQVRRCWRRR